MEKANIIFAIALRSKGSSRNWNNTVDNFNKTIKSIFNQTDQNFLVYVGCNEVPELYDDYDARLQFFLVNNPVPTEPLEMRRDKFWKYSLVACKIKEYLLKTNNPNDGIFVLPMDADDYVSNRICKYVGNHPDANGYISDYGYVYYYGKKHFMKYNDMHTFCGSCNIVKMYPDDLPDGMPCQELCFDKKTAGELNDRYPIRWNHIEVATKYESIGKPFSVLPFPSTIYCLNNGDNISEHNRISANKTSVYTKIRGFLSKIKHYPENKKREVKITKEICEEFAFSKAE